MRFVLFIVFSICIFLGSGCMTQGPKVLSTGDDFQIEAEAFRIAKADIEMGRPRVCHAGTVASGPVGIGSAEALALVRDLPTFPLPAGCAHPLALPAVRFAEVYNRTILQHLQSPNGEL